MKQRGRGIYKWRRESEGGQEDLDDRERGTMRKVGGKRKLGKRGRGREGEIDEGERRKLEGGNKKILIEEKEDS
jgi:hypothetical protein